MSSQTLNQAPTGANKISTVDPSYLEEVFIKKANMFGLTRPLTHLDSIGAFHAYLRRHYVLPQSGDPSSVLTEYCDALSAWLLEVQRGNWELTSADLVFLTFVQRGSYRFDSVPYLSFSKGAFPLREKTFWSLVHVAPLGVSNLSPAAKPFVPSKSIRSDLDQWNWKRYDNEYSYSNVVGIAEIVFKNLVTGEISDSLPKRDPPLVLPNLYARDPRFTIHVTGPRSPTKKIVPDGTRLHVFSRQHQKALRLLPLYRKNAIEATLREGAKMRDRGIVCVPNGALQVLSSCARNVSMNKKVFSNLVLRADVSLVRETIKVRSLPSSTYTEFLVSRSFLPFNKMVFKDATSLGDYISRVVVTRSDSCDLNAFLTILDSPGLSRSDRMYILDDVLLRAYLRGVKGEANLFRPHSGAPANALVVKGDSCGLSSHASSFPRVVAIVRSVCECAFLETSTRFYESGFTPDSNHLSGIMKEFIALSPFLGKVFSIFFIASEIHSKAAWISMMYLSITYHDASDIRDYLSDLVSNFDSKYIFEGGVAGAFVASDIFAAANRLLETFSIVGLISALGGVFSVDVVDKWRKFITPLLQRQPLGIDPFETFVSRGYGFLKVLLTKVKNAVLAGDVSLLFGNTPTPHEWIMWSDSLLSDESLRLDPARPAIGSLFLVRQTAGYFPPEVTAPLDVPGRSASVEKLIKLYDRVKATVSSDPVLLASLKNRYELLKVEERALALQQANSSYRISPFGLLVYGPPGSGKTTEGAEFHAALAKSLGLPGDETTMYRMDPNSNFHDTYEHNMFAALLDDIDQSAAAPSNGFLTHVEHVNRLINTAPYPMEKASVPQKGKYFANFMYVFYMTNFMHCNLRDRTMVPLMFYRRFPLRVHLTVIPEVSNAKGGIDSLKLSALEEKARLGDSVAAELVRTMHVYTVFEFYPDEVQETDPSMFPYRELFTTRDKPKFMLFLLDAFHKHLDKERQVLSRRKPSPDSVSCSECFRLSSAHRDGVLCSRSFEAAQSLFLAVFVCYFLKDVPSLFSKLYSRSVQLKVYSYMITLVGWSYLFLAFVEHIVPKTISFVSVSKDIVARRIARVGKKLRDFEALVALDKMRKSRYIQVCGLIVAALPLAFAYWKSTRSLEAKGPLGPPMLPPKKDPWLRVPPNLWQQPYSVAAKKTYVVDELVSVIQKRIVRLRRFVGDVATNLHGFMLCGGILIFPKHLLVTHLPPSEMRDTLSGPTDFEIYLGREPHGAWTSLSLLPSDCVYVPNRDIVIAWVPEIPVPKTKWDLVSELPPTCLATDRFRADDALMVYPDEIKRTTSRLSGQQLEGGYVGPNVWASSFDTTFGDCGLPIVATFGDRFYVVGFHSMKDEFFFRGNVALGESFSLTELNPIVQRLRKMHGSSFEVVFDPLSVSTLFESNVFRELPPKSSLGVAITRNSGFQGLIFGEASVKLGGSSMKSSVVPTLFRDDPEVMAKTSSLFDAGDDFAIPEFSGRMDENGVWIDPHVRSISTYLNSPGVDRLWMCAVGDFLGEEHEFPYLSSLVPLSKYSALIGVDTTTVGGFDLKTSAGLPFLGNKKTCVHVDREGPVPEVLMSPVLDAQMNRILEILSAGDLYSPIAVHCLKDEVVTRSKNNRCKVRVFNVLGFSFNLLLKMYVAPLVSVFRSHPVFFESAIGLNLAGLIDGTMVYNSLKRYPNWMASDVSDFDVHASTRELYYSCLVVMLIAKKSGYDPAQLKILWGLLLSSIHVTHVVKGDFFFANFALPSGYWVTLFLNCIRNSLQARYAFFDLRPIDCSFSFREVCAQFVLGDDNIATVRSDCAWFNQVDIAKSLERIGSVRVSSRKGAILSFYEDEKDVTFLKRSPVFLDGKIVWRIEEKTLWRMLNFRRKGELSSHDHHCVILSTILAESWMYGESTYELYLSLSKRLAEKFDLSGHFVKFPTFTELLARYSSGVLCVWDPFNDFSLNA